jgi:hypothetical protein
VKIRGIQGVVPVEKNIHTEGRKEGRRTERAEEKDCV